MADFRTRMQNFIEVASNPELAAGSEWWNGLSRKEKREYIVAHPKSSYAKSDVGQRVLTKHVIRHSRRVATSQKRADAAQKRADKHKAAGRDGAHQRNMTKVKRHQANIKKYGNLADKLKGALAPAARKQIDSALKTHKSAHAITYKGGKIVKRNAGVAAKPVAKAPAKKAAPAKVPAKKAAPAKPVAKVPAKKAAPAPAKKAEAPVKKAFEGKKGSLHEHLKVPHGQKIPHDKLIKLAKSDHPLAGRAQTALRFQGIKGDFAKKPAPAAKAPAAKAPVKKIAPKAVEPVEKKTVQTKKLSAPSKAPVKSVDDENVKTSTSPKSSKMKTADW